jgi:protein TonB
VVKPPHPPKPSATPRPAKPVAAPPTAEAPSAPSQAAAAPLAQAASAASEPALIGAHPVAGLASNGKPAYPAAALHRREEGTVVVRVDVGTDGRPLSARVERSSGHPLLDDAAVGKVMSDWRFVPASRGGVPVAGSALVPFSFRISE